MLPSFKSITLFHTNVLFDWGSGFEGVYLKGKCVESLVVWMKGWIVRKEEKVYKNLWVMW